MDARTRSYPPLPARPPQRVILPQHGDLRVRPLVPLAFIQQFYIHCPPAHRHVYRRFRVTRQFVVLARSGDMFTKTATLELRMDDLPDRTLLPLPPPLAPWDVVKVLDLVQCYTYPPGNDIAIVPNVRWELVRVRWRNSRETWIPIELMASQSPTLLQEFFVNSINSWGFHTRVYPQSWTRFRTEIELWLHHPELQKFYEQLRRRQLRAQQTSNTQTVDVKDRRLTAEAARANHTSQPQPPPPSQSRSQPQPQQQQQRSQSTYANAQPFYPPGSHRQAPFASSQLSYGNYQPQTHYLPRPGVPNGYALSMQRPGPAFHHQSLPFAQHLQQPQQHQQYPQPYPPVQQHQQHQHQQMSGGRIHHLTVASLPERPPHPPTPPRPSQEQPVELHRSLTVPSPRGFVLPARAEPTHQPTENHHVQQQKTKESRTSKSPDSERHHKVKKDRADRSSHREGVSPARDKEKERKKKEKDSRSSRREKSSPARAKERKKEKKKKTKARKRDASPETPRTKQRRRKRLKWSQAADESDESDDLLEPVESDKHRRKRLKRLRRVSAEPETVGPKDVPIIVIDVSDNDETTHTTLEKAVKKKEKVKTDRKKKNMKETEETTNCGEGEAEVAVEIDVNAFSDVEDYDDDQDADGETSPPTLLGEIRCVCGVKRAGKYVGQWLQCCKEACSVRQHTECVGYLGSTLPERYCCSTCDPDAYQERYKQAKSRLRFWLSLCCKSHNQTQLLNLLTEAGEQASDLAASTTGDSGITLLMEAARHGLAHAVRRLLGHYHVNVFATDARSRNALHYAVMGESAPIVRFLMNHSLELVRHQDLMGQMPLHRMLASSSLNSLCLPLLQQDHVLCVTSDFAGDMPIHFACRVVTPSTVEIVRHILSVESMHGIERSHERLAPLHYLCRASGSSNDSLRVEKASCITAIIEQLLDIDVLGGFLNARDPRGWTPLHFVAATGNHGLLLDLCHRRETEIDTSTFDSGETALHIAARANHAQCLDVLLTNRRLRLDVAAVDGVAQWIPVLCTTSPACLQLLLCYNLDQQLECLSTLARDFHHHDALRDWLRRVVRDPTSFAIVNDWLQDHTPLLDEWDELLRLHRSFARVDCKLEYLYGTVLTFIKRQHHLPEGPAVEITLSSSSGECCWKQFVAQTQAFDAVVFRMRLRIAIARSGNSRLDSLTLVLVRLLAGLLHPTTGLFVRSEVDSTLTPSPHRRADDPETLRAYFVLGELVAYLVLRDVSVGEVFEFSTAYLAAVVGQQGESESVEGLEAFTLGVFAESFAAGFDAVVPATLAILQPEELRMVLNARTHSLNVKAVDWATAIEWNGFANEAERTEGVDQDLLVVTWWKRMVSELVEDECVALVLWLTGSFRHAQRVLFTAIEEGEATAPRIRIERCMLANGEKGVTQDEEALAPVLDATTRTLVLPQYASYERFRVAVLGAFRHADDAVGPVRRMRKKKTLIEEVEEKEEKEREEGERRETGI